MSEKEIEFDKRIIKGLIKIAQTLKEKRVNPIEFYEQLKKEGDTDTAFAFGVLTAYHEDWFAERVYYNYLIILQKIKENKSEEEILREFEEKAKEKEV